MDIDGKLTLFADDTTILWIERKPHILQNKIQNDLVKVKQWCDANYLTFNFKKTNILSFKCTIDDVPMQNDTIVTRSSTKFLGITIDSRLSFSDHITAVNKKLSAGCYVIRVISKQLNHSMARSLYFSIIESNIRYGIAFWGFANKQLLQSVFVLQKRALRYLCGLNFRDHCREHFRRERILTLVCVFILETVTLIHKKYINVSNENLHNTRHGNELRLPIPRSTLTKQSIVYESLKLYNHLPMHFKSLNCLKKFRMAVKKLFQSKAYYSVDEFYQETF